MICIRINLDGQYCIDYFHRPGLSGLAPPYNGYVRLLRELRARVGRHLYDYDDHYFVFGRHVLDGQVRWEGDELTYLDKGQGHVKLLLEEAVRKLYSVRGYF